MLTAGAFAWYVPHDRQALRAIFMDFRTEPAWPMVIAFGVPTAMIVAGMAVFVVAAIFVQIRSRSKRSAAVFHLLLTVVMCVLFLAYREVVGSGMVSLVQAVGAPSIGR